MGTRGPQPRPTSEKLRLGETRPSRINYTEPVPRQRPPRMPPNIRDDPGAATVWRHVMRDQPSGMILSIDTFVLEQFCHLVAASRRSWPAYGRSVGIAKGRDGGAVVNPLHRVTRDQANEIRVLARELGLSPAARAGLHVEGEGGVRNGIEDVLGPSPRQLRVMAGGGRADREEETP